MYTERKKNFTVTITDGDRALVKRCFPKAPLTAIDSRAVARAAARQVLIESRSTSEALDCMTYGIPRATLENWMKGRIKLPH